MGRLRRIRLALLALCGVLVVGTTGYVLLGFGVLDAAYQTVTTVSTVGFREVHPLGPAGQVFTIVLILTGVGTALYTFGVLLEVLIEGDLRAHVERRRMDRAISRMTGHTIVCGWGRVGVSSTQYLGGTGQEIVVIDRDPARLNGVRHPSVLGDVTDDRVLLAAGIAHARALIAAVDTDADNVYVTLSARSLRPDLIIVAPAGRCGPRGQPAADRGPQDGGIRAAAACRRLPRRRHARRNARLPARTDRHRTSVSIRGAIRRRCRDPRPDRGAAPCTTPAGRSVCRTSGSHRRRCRLLRFVIR